mgnify:CR=1 FL=1
MAESEDPCQDMLRGLAAARDEDLRRQTTCFGPHRDDLELILCGEALKAFGSQGQMRTAALAMKLAAFDLLEAAQGEPPLLLLDDVLSELDEKRQDFVLNQISTGQVFITCCEPGRFTKLGKTMEISNGEAV